MFDICLVVHRVGLIRVCSSDNNNSSAFSLIIFLSMALLGCEIRLNVIKIWHKRRLPFFDSRMVNDFVYCS